MKFDFKLDSFTINVPTVQILGTLYTDYQTFSQGFEVVTLNNGYTKSQVYTNVLLKANQSTTYTKTEIDTALSNITASDIGSWSSGNTGYHYLDAGGSG